MAKKILIIEDEIPIKELYERVFKKHGWEALGVVTGNEAFEKGKDIQFDIILLDIMLPEKSGVDVLKDLKADTSPFKNVPVFMLTNLGQDSIIKQAFKLGADGYLLKAQLLPEQIVTEVENFLKSKAKPTKN